MLFTFEYRIELIVLQRFTTCVDIQDDNTKLIQRYGLEN